MSHRCHFCVKNSNSTKKERALVPTHLYIRLLCVFLINAARFVTNRQSILTHFALRCSYSTHCECWQLLKADYFFVVDRYTLKSMNTSNVMFVCCILLACLCYTYKYAATLIVKAIYRVHILYNQTQRQMHCVFIKWGRFVFTT